MIIARIESLILKNGLEDVKAGTENDEDQPMLKEIQYALPLVKNLSVGSVIKSVCGGKKAEKDSWCWSCKVKSKCELYKQTYY